MKPETYRETPNGTVRHIEGRGGGWVHCGVRCMFSSPERHDHWPVCRNCLRTKPKEDRDEA